MSQFVPPPRKPEVSLPIPAFQSLRVIIALMLREMSSLYGRSPGGYLWAILSPLGAICVMALAFGLLVHAPALGTSFLLFYATGYLPFDMFSSITGAVGGAVSYSRPLLAYPRVTWIDSVLARFTLNVLTSMTVFCIVTTTIMVFVDAHVVLRIGRIVSGLGMAALLAMGVGLMNCMLAGYFPVWMRIWNIASRPLFLASGVFFLIEGLPPKIRDLLSWNPLAHCIAQVRSGFYPNYQPQFVSASYTLGLALAMIAFALLILRRGYLASLQR